MNIETLCQRIRKFIDDEVIPEESWKTGEAIPHAERLAALEARMKNLGFGSPQLSQHLGGMGLSWEHCAQVMEVIGRSYLGPTIFQCAPPTQPDIFALEKLASPQQRERYLMPLLRGARRSCFAMTEPAPGAGSDPRALATTAEKTDNGWRLNGHKWFITGAAKADFAIVMATTSSGPSWFLVDSDTPGFTIIRDIATIEPFDMGGHGEILLENCNIPDSALVGETGQGLAYAQIRLESARLFHCMRYIGLASRAMDYAQDYATQRLSGGKPLGDHQMVQQLIADAHIKLYAARMMTRDVAKRLDEDRDIRHHSSMTKVFVSEAVYSVADAAVQICGGLGVSEDAPLAFILRMLRPFRIYDGASEVHRSAIARRALKHGLSA